MAGRRFGVHPVVAPVAVAVLVACACVAVREVSGGSLLSVVAGLVTVVAAVAAATTITVRYGLDGLGIALLGVAVTTSTWNAVALGPLKPTHMYLALAVVVLGLDAAARRRPVRLPGWVWVLAAAIGVVVVLSMVWPPSAAYFATRYARDVPDPLADIDALGAASAVGGVKWLVAVLGLPLAVTLAATARPRCVPALAVAWAVGATVSAGVALGDGLGITALGRAVLPVDFGGRQPGLSVHPNHVALGAVLALPVLVWCWARTRGPAALWPVGAAVVIAGGLLLSGSRAGYGGAVVAIGLATALDPVTRRRLPLPALGAVLGGLLAVALRPELVPAVGRRLRLVDDETAAASDDIRSGLAGQALADAAHSPLHGLGFEVIAQGHSIYLQLLAAGGVVLLFGWLLAQVGFLSTAWTMTGEGRGLTRALAVSGVVFLVVGVVSNQLTDVFVHVPFALVTGLWAVEQDRSVGVPAGRDGPFSEREESYA